MTLTRGSHTESPPATGNGTRAGRLTGGAAVAGVVLALGAASTSYLLVVLGLVLLLIGAVALLNVRPVVWIALALVSPWVCRIFTTTGLAPRFLDFLDFPLTGIAFVSAGAAYLNGKVAMPGAHRRICHLLLLVVLVMAASWALNDVGEPLRLVAGVALALQPFFLLAALLLAPLGARDRRLLIGLVVGVMALQLPFALAQIAGGARIDFVKGTLLETEAGHHVFTAGLALGFFFLVGLRASKVLLVGFGVLALFVSVVADAKQVLFVLPPALVVLALTTRRPKSVVSAIGSILGAVALVGATVFAIMSLQFSQQAFGFVERSFTNETGKVAVASALWNDLQASPLTFAFGLGPGETVSRFSFLTAPELLQEGSPVALLDLHPSRGVEHYSNIASYRASAYDDDSSFNSPQSSALGVLGDYGVAGALAFAALLWAIIRTLLRSADRGLRSAALSGWTLLLPLAVGFDWLEQPPFTLALVIMTGLALRSPGRRELAGNEPASRDDVPYGHTDESRTSNGRATVVASPSASPPPPWMRVDQE